MPDHESIYIGLLEKELEKPISTPKQSYRVLSLVAMGLISVGREQATQSKEIYGNGIPGGIKQKIIEAQNDIVDLKNIIQSPHSPLPQPKPEQKDTFSAVVKWFTDKVLPALTIGFILFITQMLLLAWAMNAGYIK